MDSQQKELWGRALRKLAVPIILIFAAIFYQPLSDFLNHETPTDSFIEGDKLVVSYLDVGQGDATLIRKGDFAMLIDAGKNEQGSKVVEYLKNEGVQDLDLVVGTHPDSDHIGGLDDVINELNVDLIYMSRESKETKTYKDVQKSIKKKGLQASMPEMGKEITYDGNVKIRFLSPGKKYSDSNDNSLVVQLAYGKNKFLFMGDAEESAEEDMIKKGYDLECDVLKLGHHGSYTATSQEFLEKADPTYGVISCGKNNSYGHPHAEVLSRLEDEDVQIYRTDRMGTIEAISDGTNVSLSTNSH